MQNITSNTRIIPIFGNPVKHSLSPIMQNNWLISNKLDFIYLAFAVESEDLKQAIQSIKFLNMAGANITVPYKNDVIEFLDGIDKTAEKIGSVNTIVNKNGKLIGYNTDGDGLIADLKSKKINLQNKTILVVGAGGASKAVLYALNKLKVKKIYLTSRTYKTAEAVSHAYKNIIPLKINEIEDNLFIETDCIINSSTCGMKSNDKMPFHIKRHKKDIILYDLIYNKETPFKKFAADNKLKYFSGEGMLVYQGAIAFEKWTGIKPGTKDTFALLRKYMEQNSL
ncbi:MAG: shikimate dehydrogenase [Endomicrobiaceae bacterium]